MAADVQHNTQKLQHDLDAIFLTRKREAVAHPLRLPQQVATAALTYLQVGGTSLLESCVTDGLIMAQLLAVASENAKFVIAAYCELHRPVIPDRLLAVHLGRTKVAGSISARRNARKWKEIRLSARMAVIKACTTFNDLLDLCEGLWCLAVGLRAAVRRLQLPPSPRFGRGGTVKLTHIVADGVVSLKPP